MARHAARGSEAAQSAFRPINRGFYHLNYLNYVYGGWIAFYRVRRKERSARRTMLFPLHVLSGVVCDGWKSALLLPTTGARRSFASRVGWGGMAIRTVALRLPCPSRPFGLDV